MNAYCMQGAIPIVEVTETKVLPSGPHSHKETDR